MRTAPPPMPPERPAGVVPSAPEPRLRALLAIPIALAAVVVGGLAMVLVAGLREALTSSPMPRDGLAGVAAHGTPPALVLSATFVQGAALVAGTLAALAVGLGGLRSLAALGLRSVALKSAAALVVGGYVAFLVLAAIWSQALGITDRENVAVDLGSRDGPVALAGAIVVVCVVAPLAEELFFRGFLFRALRRHGLLVAAGITGVAFGLAHGASSPIGFLVPLALLGVLLCLLYERTGSLYPCIALHCLNNSIAFGVADGRGWLVPVCLLGSGALIVAVLRVAELLLERGGRAAAAATG